MLQGSYRLVGSVGRVASTYEEASDMLRTCYETVARKLLQRDLSTDSGGSVHGSQERATDRVESGGHLQDGGEEPGGEREGRQPEDHRRVRRRRPLLELIDTKDQIASPRRQRLHRRICLHT